MTPEEFKNRMAQLWDFSDPTNDRECAHFLSDALICDLLRSFGYGAGVEIFESNGKWYS